MKKIMFAVTLAATLVAQAEIMDRPTGFKVGQRMTVRPYVALTYTYDSNVNSTKHANSGSSWVVNPGFTADYKGENWSLQGGAFYQYHAYAKNSNNLNQNSYGQNLAYNWANSAPGEKGWSLTLRESYQMISQDDDASNDGGRGVGRDRQQFQFAGNLQRRINERWHADVEGTYYYIDYDNKRGSYAPMYGWKRWTAGGQLGYAASKWTDFIVTANYQEYSQDNDSYRGGESGPTRDTTHYSSRSKGWSVQGGVGTHATERISYRLTAGWNHFEYAGGVKKSNGFAYTVSSSWQMSDRWTMMLLVTDYYKPSEQSYGSSTRIDSISWGLGHAMVRGKLNATLDINYRHQKQEYTHYYASDYDEDILTGRIGFNYTINRFVSAFTNLEYQMDWIGGNSYRPSYDYDRWRWTVGMRLTY